MKYLDFYGTNYNLSIFGKSSHKTKFSFAVSILTLTLVSIGTWLIGRDMFQKRNPKIIESTFIPEKSESVRVNNKNFTIAFRMEDYSGEPPTEENTFAFPHFYYEVFKKGETGYLDDVFRKIYTPVPCLETETKDNPSIAHLKPETLNCFDMAQIKRDLLSEGLLQEGKDLDLYGEFQEDYVSAFYLIYSNCKYKNGEIDGSSCVSIEEMLKIEREYTFLNLYHPTAAFRPENYDNPFRTQYSITSVQLSPFTKITTKLQYSVVTFNDDRGWIFEDVNQTKTFELGSKEQQFHFLPKESFTSNSVEMAIFDINFGRKQFTKTRIYMKIPELAANLGGLLKICITFFGFLTRKYSFFAIETELISKYLVQKPENTRNNNSISIVSQEQPSLSPSSISIFDYLKAKYWKTSELTDKKQLIDKLKKTLDLDCLTEILIEMPKNKTKGTSIIRFQDENNR